MAAKIEEQKHGSISNMVGLCVQTKKRASVDYWHKLKTQNTHRYYPLKSYIIPSCTILKEGFYQNLPITSITWT